MGDQSDLPRINEVAAYLKDAAPEVRADLRSQGQLYVDLTELGTIGGAESLPEDAFRAGLIARAKILNAALGDAIAKSEVDLGQIGKKLKSLKWFRFVSQTLSAIGASGVVAFAFSIPAATLAGGIIALAASISGLAAENLVLGANKGGEAGLRDQAAILTRVIGQGGLTRKLLSTLDTTGFNTDEIRTIIADGNQLFEELLKARGAQIALSLI